MKTFLASVVLGMALLMNACGDGKSDAAKQMAAAADSARTSASVDLAEYHMPLLLKMPIGAPEPALVWKDAAGKLEVRAGDHFTLEISEAPADLERVKADLDRDLLKKNTIVQETSDLLIYRSEFPDDTTLIFYHFDQWITTDGRSFHVEDAEDGSSYTLEDITRMADAVQVKTPA